MNLWWNWRKAVFGKIDQDYRRAYLRDDKSLVRIILALAAIWALSHSYIEYLDLGLVSSFYLLIFLRLIFISASLLFILNLPKINDVNKLDLALLLWSVTIVLLTLISNIYRNNIHIENASASLAWVLGFYIVVPNRQLYKLIPALLLSFISFYTLLRPESVSLETLTRPTFMANISSILAMNLIGFLTSLWLESHRYQQYMIQKTMMDGRAQLKELATTDSLTGILNRRSFFESAEVQFDRFKRYKERFSFVIIDIDNLKRINDTFGHPAGDHSILLLTDTINAEKRLSDMIGRLAGDEFGIILPNTSAGRTSDVLMRMQEVLEDTIVESPNKRQFQVSFSAGVTEVKKTDEIF